MAYLAAFLRKKGRGQNRGTPEIPSLPLLALPSPLLWLRHCEQLIYEEAVLRRKSNFQAFCCGVGYVDKFNAGKVYVASCRSGNNQLPLDNGYQKIPSSHCSPTVGFFSSLIIIQIDWVLTILMSRSWLTMVIMVMWLSWLSMVIHC